jgi:D-alanyl-lipoteichoic acid acyltransferase DltB (MBOAT superfamily)
VLFNSGHFLIFFPIVVILFFSLKSIRIRQLLLLGASWYFYTVWKPEYFILLLSSTAVDYFAAKKIEKSEDLKIRKRYLWLSIIINIGILISFKYFHFFDKNLHRFLAHYNLFIGNTFEQLLLPVGISFYTFQTISYTIDVYRKKISAEKNFIKFALFVSFFPQLVAGPIERAGHLLPQFNKLTGLDYKRITDGLKLIIWGFFQKIVIADSMALLVDTVYKNPDTYYGADIWLATLFFAVQIYGDFSGYTDIARGSAKILGYNLNVNFRIPYLSDSISEFWKRWHISLSTWFRDYIYIPLGGNRTKTKRRYWFNIMFVFILSGFWHGAGWTFLIWGALHGIFYLFEQIFPVKLPVRVNNFNKIFRIIFTFTLVNFAWIFFRSESVKIAYTLMKNSFVFNSGQLNFNHLMLLTNVLLIGFLLMVNIIERKNDIISYISEKSLVFRWSVYYIVIITIFLFGNFGIQEFIYFRF